MIVAESQVGRRLIGRLDKGADLEHALGQVCARHGVRSAEVRVSGWLEEAEFRDYDPRLRAYRPLRRAAPPLAIVHLRGTIAEDGGKLQLLAQAVLSRDRPEGIELLGGQLHRARVLAVEFVIESFDDVLLRRAVDGSVGAPFLASVVTRTGGGDAGAAGPREAAPVRAGSVEDRASRPSIPAPPRAPAPPAPPAAAPPPAPAALSWQDVAARSAAISAGYEPSDDEQSDAAGPASAADRALAAAAAPPAVDEDDGDDEDREEDQGGPRAGEVIEHPTFGRCEVERNEGDGDYVQVRLSSRRLVRLAVEALNLSVVARDDKGKRRWKARMGKP